MARWETWLKNLPDHPTLHTPDSLSPGLDSIVSRRIDTRTTYSAGPHKRDNLVSPFDQSSLLPTLRSQKISHANLLPLYDLDVSYDMIRSHRKDSLIHSHQILAADSQFGSQLYDKRSKGGIIFEVSYSEAFEHAEHAKKKAKKYLFPSDLPRPSVVVIFNFEERVPRKAKRDVDLNLEVLRRQPSKQGEVKVYEMGVSA